METQNINGDEYIPINSIELDGNAEDVQERLSRAIDELNTKQAQRQQIENDRSLTSHIHKHFSRELKDVDSFISLCKAKKLMADDDDKILKLYKSLPKSAKKSTLSRFLKL